MSDVILEPLGDELLVYDITRHEAHALATAQASRLKRARVQDRRRVLKSILAAGAGVVSMSSPTVAQAASQCVSRCRRGDRGKSCGAGCKRTCRFPGVCE